MIHSGEVRSIERFIGVLTEHYAGAFPPWLSPVQVLGVPVAEDFNDTSGSVLAQMKKQGIRSSSTSPDDRFQEDPQCEQGQGALSSSSWGGGVTGATTGVLPVSRRTQENGVPIDAAIAKVRAAIDEKWQVSTAS